MKTKFNFFFTIMILFITAEAYSQWTYPSTRTADSTETYFGVTIKDPYQWIEDLKSTEVQDWFKSQADYTDGILTKIPGRDKLISEMMELDKIKKVKYNNIEERAGRYFFFKRLPGEDFDKFYFRKNLGAEDILLLDPSEFRKDKQFTLEGYTLDNDGKKVLISISESGKERASIIVMNVDNRTFYPDEIETAYSGSWVEGKDNTFTYLKLKGEDVHDSQNNLDSRYMMHTLGEPFSSDKELLSRLHDPELNIKPEEYPFVGITPNEDYIFAFKGSVDNNHEIYFAHKNELLNEKINWKKLCDKDDEITSVMNFKDDIYLLTSKDASNFKVVKTDLKNPVVKNAKLVFDGGDVKIESIGLTKDYLIITQIKNGVETKISKLNLNSGAIEPINLPLNGTISISPLSPFSNLCSVWNSGWTTPSNLYTMDLENSKFEKGAFNVEFEYPGIENIVSEEVEVMSHDGVMVPLSIIYDKTKFKNDGSNICHLDGYGAYGYSYTPYFSTANYPLLQRGVVFAVAHVRGGGEKGEDWYRAGWKTTKPNTWKDFIACGDYLVKNNYTSNDKLAGSGTSAGGILIGRAITERPDLFKVAIPKVGCLNTLRGEFSPNGPVNIPEFGTVESEEDFKALYEMDAYHHLKEGEKYPATLVTTGYNDPRVISWTPAKFAARLQEVNSSSNPVLLQVDYNTGHFGGEKISDYFRNISDIYSFVMWQCGHPDFQPKAN